MKKLKQEFTGTGEVKGWSFRQIASNGYAFIYEVKQPMVDESYYEVFPRRVNGHTNSEEYPPRKAFGISAYCCIGYDKANEVYRKLSKRERERKDAEFQD